MNRVMECPVTWRRKGPLRRLLDRLWWGHREHACIHWAPIDEFGEHTRHQCECGHAHITPRHRAGTPYTEPGRPVAAVLGSDGTRNRPVVAAIEQGGWMQIISNAQDAGLRMDVDQVVEAALKPDPTTEFRRQWLDDAIWAHAEALSGPVSDRRPGGRQGPTETPERPAGAQRAGKEQGSSENPPLARRDPPPAIKHNHDGQGPFHPECFACNGPYAALTRTQRERLADDGMAVRYYAEETRRT